MSADAEPGGRGGTRWRRFALVLGAGLAVAAVMVVLLAQGAIAATFTVAGVPFKISADQLRAQGFVQYTGTERTGDGGVPVIINGLRTLEGDNFCQSILMELPLIGPATVRFVAPGRAGMSAEDIVVSTERLSADLTLLGPQVGRDAGTLEGGPPGAVGPAGTFGIQASGQILSNVRQVSRAVTAATLNLNQASISVDAGRNECFA